MDESGLPVAYDAPPNIDLVLAPGGQELAAPGEKAEPTPQEFRASVSRKNVPPSETYEGGGIFSQATTGPSLRDSEDAPSARLPGSDFGPNMSGAPLPPPGVMQNPHGIFHPQYPNYHPHPHHLPGMPPMAPVGDMPNEKAHTLGLSVIGIALGAAVGYKYGGFYGSVAGTLGAGALINAYRAYRYAVDGTEESDKEAKVSGTYAVGAAVLSGVIWAKLVESSHKMHANPDDAGSDKGSDDDSEDDDVGSDERCHIRPVGP